MSSHILRNGKCYGAHPVNTTSSVDVNDWSDALEAGDFDPVTIAERQTAGNSIASTAERIIDAAEEGISLHINELQTESSVPNDSSDEEVQSIT